MVDPFDQARQTQIRCAAQRYCGRTFFTTVGELGPGRLDVCDDHDHGPAPTVRFDRVHEFGAVSAARTVVLHGVVKVLNGFIGVTVAGVPISNCLTIQVCSI